MQPEFILFLDENHHRTPAILQTLQQEQVSFERHQDHFSPGTPDTEWLPYIGQRGWILLTSDRRIRHRFFRVDLHSALPDAYVLFRQQ